MEDAKKEIYIHKAFEIGILLKAFNALWEIVVGLLIFFTGAVSSFANFIIEQELLEDPNDFIANNLQTIITFLSGHSKAFVAIYLIGHGLINIFLFFGILKNKLWAYEASLSFMSLFVFYQLYKIAISHSFWLSMLTILDLIMIWLIYHEYNYLKKYHHLPKD